MVEAIDPEILGRLLEILDKPYKYAKLGILDLESKSRGYSLSQILQLRDALDHIAIALVDNREEKKKQLKSLDLAEDHLRRASIESVEILVTELFYSILRILEKPPIYYRIACFSLPEKDRLEEHFERIQYHMLEGRRLKGKIEDWELCLIEFRKAYDEAKALKDQLPDRNEARYRFIGVLGILISITATAISLIASMT
jgi:hypothetical protein